MAGETGEVSSIGVKLTLDAGEFMGGMKSAQGTLNTFQEQAARAGSGASQLKAGGGRQVASGPSSAQNLSGVNVSLTLNKGQLAELRTEITRGLGSIPVSITPQFAKSGPQSIQNIMGAMLSMQYGGSPAQGRIAAKQAIERYVPQIPHRASGGAVQQGQPVVVGEHRAEVFRPGATGWIEKDIREYRRRAAELAALEYQIAQSQRRMTGGWVIPHRAQAGPAHKGGLPRGYKIEFYSPEDAAESLHSVPSLDRPGGYYKPIKKPVIKGPRSMAGVVAVVTKGSEVVANFPFSFDPSTEVHGVPTPYGSMHPDYSLTATAHRRKGLATAAYVKTERLTGRPVAPSGVQLVRGKSFWAQPDRPFGKIFGERPVDQWNREATHREDEYDRLRLEAERNFANAPVSNYIQCPQCGPRAGSFTGQAALDVHDRQQHNPRPAYQAPAGRFATTGIPSTAGGGAGPEPPPYDAQGRPSFGSSASISHFSRTPIRDRIQARARLYAAPQPGYRPLWSQENWSGYQPGEAHETVAQEKWWKRLRERLFPTRMARMAGGPVERSFRVADPMGLHMRPSSVLAQVAQRYPEAAIQIRNLTSGLSPEGLNARSMMGWAQLMAIPGDEIGMLGEGENASLALHQLARLGGSPKLTGLARRRLKRRWNESWAATHAWRGATARAYYQTHLNEGGTFPVDPGARIPWRGHAIEIPEALGLEPQHIDPADPLAFTSDPTRTVGSSFVPGFGETGFTAARGRGFLEDAWAYLHGSAEAGIPSGAKRRAMFGNLTGLDPHAVTYDSRMDKIITAANRHEGVSPFKHNRNIHEGDVIRRLGIGAMGDLFPEYAKRWGLNNISEFQAILWSGLATSASLKGTGLGADWARTATGIAIPRHPGLEVPFHRAGGGVALASDQRHGLVHPSGGFVSQIMQTAADWANDPFMAIMSWQSLMQKQKRAGGGRAGEGLYVVGEIGKELFVPNRLAHLVPKHVMDQIPKRAGGGIVEIGRKRNEIFAPPEDGLIIPNRLIDQIPHAAEGLRGRGIDVGAAMERANVPGVGEAQGLLRTMTGPVNVAQATITNTGAINAPQATVAATAPQRGTGHSTWAPGEEDAIRASLKAGAGTTKGGKFQFEAAGSDWAALDAAAKGQGGAGPEDPIAAMRAEAKAEYREEKRYGEQPPSRMEERLEELQVSRAGLSSTMRGSSPKMAIAQISSWLLGGRQEFTQAGAGVTVAANAFRRVNRETSSEIGELTKFIDKLRAATGGSAEEEADRTKSIEKATADRAALEKRQNEAVENLDRANQKALPTNAGVLKNLGVIIGATSLYGMAMQAASTVLTEAAIPAVGKLIDEFTGWGSTFTKTTMALGEQARQMGGNVDVAIATTGAQAGLSAETAKWMGSVLQASTVAKAGSANFAEVSELFKASFGASGRSTQGLYGAYGGVGGSSLFAEQIGGSQGYLQRVAGTARAAHGSENIVADVMDAVGTTLPMLVGGVFGAQSGWNMLGDQSRKIRGTDPVKLGRIADDMQAGMDRVSKRTGEVAYNFGLLTDAEKARLQSVKNLPAEAADLAKYGLGFRDAAGNLITDLKELDKAVLQSAKGYTIPDPQEWIGIMSQQIKGQFATLDIKSEINRTLIIPLEYATSRIAEPLTPPGTGLIPGSLQVGRMAGALPGFVGKAMYQGLGASERGAGWLADAARMQRELRTQNDQALADARARIVEMSAIPGTAPSTTGAPGVPVSGSPIVNANTGFVTGVAGSPVVNPSTGFVTGMAGTTPSTQGPQVALWDKYIAEAKGYSAEIQSINNQIGTMSAILNQTQWANASRLAHRALADARDYWKGVDSQGGKSLGAVQKRLWDIGRTQTSLGLQLQQRAITTNLAIAQFQAPGETGEERYFRQKEAIAKAGIEQQQLDLGVKAFQAQGKEWSIVAQRNIKDLSIQADVTEQQIALDKDRLAADAKIAALTDKMGLALKNASDIFGTAESKFETGLEAASKYVETFGGTIKDALVEIWKGLGYTVTMGRNGAVDVSGSSGSGGTSQSGTYFAQTQPARKDSTTVNGRTRGATGLLGLTSGATDLTVGEAGRETVAVLRNPRAATMGGGGGSSNVTVNINGPVVRGDADISSLARQVAVEVERTLSRKGQMFGLRGPAV